MSAPTNIILEIIGWSIGMIIFSQLLSKKFGTSPTQQMEMQEKMQDMQEQMQLAQSNPQLMQDLQIEMMAFMKTIMKKQLIPQLVRLLVFLGFIGLLKLLYPDYYDDGIFTFNILIFRKGAFALYIITSFTISIGMGLIRALIKKIRPGTEKKQEQFQDSVRALQRTLIISQNTGSPMGNPYARSTTNGFPMINDSANGSWKQKIIEEPKNSTPEESKSWKDKLDSD